MLARLADECQFRAVFLVVRVFPSHLLGERTGGDYLHGGAAVQTRTGRYVTVVQEVITALNLGLRMTAGNNLDTSQSIVAPRAVGLRSNSINGNLIYLLHVHRAETEYSVVVFRQQQPCAETQCAGKHATAVVVGVLSDQVYSSGGKKHFLSLAAVSLLESSIHFLCCHSNLELVKNT